MRLLLLICSAFLTSGIIAQYKVDEAQTLALKYEEDGRVMIDGSVRYIIEQGPGGPVMRMEVKEDHLIIKSGIFDQSSDQIYLDDGYTELENLVAYSLVPEKGKFKKYPVKEFFTKDDMASHLFTSDGKTMEFYFPQANAGTITHVEYTMLFKGIDFFPAAFGANYYPYHHYDVEIIKDPGIELEYTYFHMTAEDGSFQQKEQRGKEILSWEFREVPAMKYHSDAPDHRWYMPHIMFRVKGYERNGTYERHLSDQKDLHTLYRTWIDQIEAEPDTLLAFVAEELVLGKETELEKLEAIFAWVQKNIKYIAFSDGKKGLVPQSAIGTLECRYGDCKAMSNLMYEMAHTVGIQTHLTWIGSRDLPYSYDEFPSPNIDNHMILTYLGEDTTIFLDATDSYIPFGLPSGFTQGKQALITTGPESFTTKTVPVVTAAQNEILDSVQVQVVEKDLHGTGIATLNGYQSARFRRNLDGLDKEEERLLVKSMVRKGDDRFHLDNYNLVMSQDKREVVIEYGFHIPDYVSIFSNKAYLNMNLEEYFGGEAIEKDRDIPIEFNSTWSSTVIIDLELSAGQQVSFLPENSSEERELFGYRVQYENHPEAIRYQLDIYSNCLLLKPEEFEQWNAVKVPLQKAAGQNIIIGP